MDSRSRRNSTRLNVCSCRTGYLIVSRTGMYIPRTCGGEMQAAGDTRAVVRGLRLLKLMGRRTG